MSTFDLAHFAPPLAVPEVRAGPVILRPFALGDLPLIRRASSDPYIPSITSVPPHYSDDEGRAFIARQHDRADGGHGFPFVIAAADNPAHGLGATGLWLREIDSGRASIGYWLVSDARGKGLATWALRGITTFAFQALAIPRLQLFIEPWNAASRRTAELAGYAQEALLRGWERMNGAQHDALAYVRLYEEWGGPGGVSDGAPG